MERALRVLKHLKSFLKQIMHDICIIQPKALVLKIIKTKTATKTFAYI